MLFYQEYADEPLLGSLITYSDMKNFYLIQVTDSRYQTDHITRKKLNSFRNIDVLLMKLY